MTEPSILEKVKSLLQDSAKWVKAGCPLASNEVIADRYSKCAACEYFCKEAYEGSGKCLLCGCSTKAKIILETSQCPEGKW
jgi:hypothetical protein